MNKTSLSVLMLVVLLAAALAACSRGGGGTAPPATVALTVTEKVSVVEPKISSAVAAVKPLLMAASVPADSDYTKDKTNVYVQERSVELFGNINNILCMIGQTKYDEMMNKGPYLAQIDEKQCDSNRGDASQAGQESSNQSSGANAPSYEAWTVESSRASDNSPQIVKAWIHQDAKGDYDPAQTIVAKVTIDEGKSDTNPVGIFNIQFKATLPDDPNAMIFKGYLRSKRDTADTTKILLQMVDGTTVPNDPYPRMEAATLSKSADGASGSGSAYRKETWSNNGSPETHEFKFDIAYNTDYFLRSIPSSTLPNVCLDRTKFDMSAWRYGLYDATTGARVVRNSGFPIKYGNYYGNVGYWGLWLPNGVTLNNGDTIYKHDYQANTDVPYTVFIAKGKLKKHTKKTFALDEIKYIPLDYWQNSGNSRVVWTGTAFNIIAQMPSNCTSNCTWQNLTEPYPIINFSQLQWSELNFWSQALGGQVRVPLGTSTPCSYITSTTGPSYVSCPAPTGSTNVIFYQEDMIYPTDSVPSSLVCYDQCPQATTNAGIDIDGVSGNYVFYQTWVNGTSTSHSYSFDSSTMLLKDGTFSVITTTTTQQNQWGVNTGALFDPAILGQTNPDTGNPYLKCDWDNNVCGWKAWSELPVFYTWETGPNNWNRFTAIKDTNNSFVKFDPPLQVQYTHSQSDAAAPDWKYNNTKFSLEYGGFGQLYGIPSHCVNMDTGAIVSCDQGSSGVAVRWVPEFFIPAGASLGASNEYIAKPLEMEQRMRQSTACIDAGLSTQSYALPSISEWS
ncbi:MAG: hypothetical protein OEW15_18815, partial [Nitrospirota bacterium]|nr:hypothetical protein [Nitrospirota bacterium]